MYFNLLPACCSLFVFLFAMLPMFFRPIDCKSRSYLVYRIRKRTPALRHLPFILFLPDTRLHFTFLEDCTGIGCDYSRQNVPLSRT